MPDLDAIMAYWIKLLGLDRDGWKITWGWVDQITMPDGGQAIGLNEGDGAQKVADIKIRRPRSQAELAELDDTVAHELVHCVGRRMQALLDAGEFVDAHEYLAETMAPAMVAVKGTPRAKALAKAAKSLPALRRAGGTKMDPEKIKAAIAALREGNGDAALQVLEELLIAAAAGAAPPASEAAPPMGQDKPPEADKPPEKPMGQAAPAQNPNEPPIGMGKGEGVMKDDAIKAMAKEMVEGLVEARPDLTPEQREYARSLASPAAVRAYFKTVKAPEAKTEKKQQAMGLDKTPRGGAGAPGKLAPSADKDLNALFRIAPEDDGSEGVEHPDPATSGVLLRHSVVAAYKHIKKHTLANVAAQKAKMLGGAQ